MKNNISLVRSSTIWRVAIPALFLILLFVSVGLLIGMEDNNNEPKNYEVVKGFALQDEEGLITLAEDSEIIEVKNGR